MKNECALKGPEGWVCSLELKHAGNIHVALGLNGRVILVWQVCKEKVLFDVHKDLK